MRLLADENFDNDILRGVQRANPDLDILRVQDTEVYQADDPIVLAWAAEDGRILLTHDKKTIPYYANERVAAGLSMPGVIEVLKQQMSLGQAIEELLIFIGASDPSEYENRVIYLPLR